MKSHTQIILAGTLVAFGCQSKPKADTLASAMPQASAVASVASAAPAAVSASAAPAGSAAGKLADEKPPAATGGKLAPAEIQKVVRAHFSQYRACYADALKTKPELQGTVKVRFTIGKDGKVGVAGNAGSDLPDVNVVKCVVHETYKLKFPKPEGGIVTVTYPIKFSPS